jgi:hypothetical protein
MSALTYSPDHDLYRARILFALIGANFNVTTDQQIHKLFPFVKWRLIGIFATNASISLTTAAGGIYMAPSKGGVAVVAAGQSYAALTTAGNVLDLTINNTDIRTEDVPRLSLTTPQGAAATADIFISGIALQ